MEFHWFPPTGSPGFPGCPMAVAMMVTLKLIFLKEQENFMMQMFLRFQIINFHLEFITGFFSIGNRCVSRELMHMILRFYNIQLWSPLIYLPCSIFKVHLSWHMSHEFVLQLLHPIRHEFEDLDVSQGTE